MIDSSQPQQTGFCFKGGGNAVVMAGGEGRGRSRGRPSGRGMRRRRSRSYDDDQNIRPEAGDLCDIVHSH